MNLNRRTALAAVLGLGLAGAAHTQIIAEPDFTNVLGIEMQDRNVLFAVAMLGINDETLPLPDPIGGRLLVTPVIANLYPDPMGAFNRYLLLPTGDALELDIYVQFGALLKDGRIGVTELYRVDGKTREVTYHNPFPVLPGEIKPIEVEVANWKAEQVEIRLFRTFDTGPMHTHFADMDADGINDRVYAEFEPANYNYDFFVYETRTTKEGEFQVFLYRHYLGEIVPGTILENVLEEKWLKVDFVPEGLTGVRVFLGEGPDARPDPEGVAWEEVAWLQLG